MEEQKANFGMSITLLCITAILAHCTRLARWYCQYIRIISIYHQHSLFFSSLLTTEGTRGNLTLMKCPHLGYKNNQVWYVLKTVSWQLDGPFQNLSYCTGRSVASGKGSLEYTLSYTSPMEIRMSSCIPGISTDFKARQMVPRFLKMLSIKNSGNNSLRATAALPRTTGWELGCAHFSPGQQHCFPSFHAAKQIQPGCIKFLR